MKTFIALCILLFATPALAEKHAVASWYQNGKRTASGERFNPNGMTAAHRTYPFGTILKVSHKNRVATVRINDRGPFVRGKQLDLARGAARALGCNSTCKVTYMVVD